MEKNQLCLTYKKEGKNTRNDLLLLVRPVWLVYLQFGLETGQEGATGSIQQLSSMTKYSSTLVPRTHKQMRPCLSLCFKTSSYFNTSKRSIEGYSYFAGNNLKSLCNIWASCNQIPKDESPQSRMPEPAGWLKRCFVSIKYGFEAKIRIAVFEGCVEDTWVR